MTKIDLVDVGGGNIGSVKRCLELLNVDFSTADTAKPPKGDRPVLLPGVGAFGPVMDHLRKTGFDQRVKDLVNSGTPYLGICVGMQILFDSSEEAHGVPGLSLVPGTVRRFTEGKVPQIGWNLIQLAQGSGENKNNIAIEDKDDSQEVNDGHNADSVFPQKGYVYFVNSFYPAPRQESDILYSSSYHVRFCAAVQKNNITAFQFHPEKSGVFGKTLLTRWIRSVS